MSLPTQKKINTFPINIQSAVFGYIREAQSLFNGMNSAYYNIPFEINHICLSFYYSNLGWDQEKCGSGLVISGLQENTVTLGKKAEYIDRTIYHKSWYHSQWKGKVSFSIKIDKLNDEQFVLFFGFASFDDIIDPKFYGEQGKINYALQCVGNLWVKYEKCQTSAVNQNAKLLQQGDEATFTLNLSESKIYMANNGLEEKVIFKNIETGEDIQYKFATALICLLLVILSL